MKHAVAIIAFTLALPVFAGSAAQTVTLDVQNMTCASCPLTVRQVLKRQSGVIEAKVDLSSHSAQVKFDPVQGQAEQFAKAVTEAGFPTTVRR